MLSSRSRCQAALASSLGKVQLGGAFRDAQADKRNHERRNFLNTKRRTRNID